MRRFAIVLTTIIIFQTSFAQSWVSRRAEGDNFHEVQAAFNAEWQDKEYEKGHGYKQFKRWEYFMESRVDENGELPPSIQIWEEYLKLKKQRSNMQTRNGSWTFSGPFEISSDKKGIGRINVVAVDPTNPSIIFVGAPGGGLWKSTNGGNNWAPKTDGLPNIGVSGIAIDYNNTNTIYIGTGDGDASDTYSFGVLKSTDGGNTWSTTGLSFASDDQRNIYKLLMHPTNPEIIFAAADNGLWKTVNGGDNWYSVSSGNIRDIEFHPTNPEVVYLCRPGLYRSDDGGENFVQTEIGLPANFQMERSAIAVSPNQPNWVYFLAVNNNNGLRGLYRSTDSGLSFSERADSSPNLLGWSSDGSGIGGQGWYDLALAVDPANADRVFVGGVNVWRSNTGGSSWTLKAHWTNTNPSSYVHADVHTLDYFGAILYCGSDGGVFRSMNNGNNWVNISDGLGITQIYGIGTTDQDPNRISIGAQDNGTNIKYNSSWANVLGGDGMQTHISPTNSNRVYSATQNGNLFVSNNGGGSFNNYSFLIQETGAWLTPYEVKTNNGNVIIAGFENIWEYDGSWTQLSDFHFATIDHIGLAPSTDDYIYFSRDNKIFKTENGGDDWEEITDGLPFVDITGIAVDPDDPEIVYVTHSNYFQEYKVYRSENGGESWENMSYNLPNVPVNCIALDDGGVYVGTDFGVFYINDNLSNWQDYSDNLPIVAITDIDILPNSNIARVSTYGRGVWDSPLYSPISEAPIADFLATPVVVCQGEVVTFVDASFNANAIWEWTFEGGEPASSSEASPEIVYPEPGDYAVTLSMVNQFGESSETKSDFIKVMNGDAQILPYSDDFESYDSFPSDEWFVKNEDNNVTWAFSNLAGHSGSNSLMLNNNESNPGEYDEIISRAINLTDGQETVLSFYFAHAKRNESNHGKLKLYFSEDCGAHWQWKSSNSSSGSLSTADPTTDFFVPTQEQWGFDSEPIEGQYLAPDFRFKLQYKSDGGNALYIDDINIAGYVGIEWFEDASGLNVYPNPAKDAITLSFEQNGKTRIEIVNMLGEIVSEKHLETSYGTQEVMLDVQHLSVGLYNLQVLSSDGVSVVQIVIE